MIHQILQILFFTVLVKEGSSHNVTNNPTPKWIVKDCLYFEGSISFTFDNNEKEDFTSKEIPENAISSGECTDASNILNLKWNNGDELTLTFKNADISRWFFWHIMKYNLESISGNIVNPTTGNSSQIHYKSNNPNTINTYDNKTWHCDAKFIFDVGHGISINLERMRILAFANGLEDISDVDSHTENLCNEDNPWYSPWAVFGYILAFLIIVGSIVYFGIRKFGGRGGTQYMPTATAAVGI